MPKAAEATVKTSELKKLTDADLAARIRGNLQNVTNAMNEANSRGISVTFGIYRADVKSPFVLNCEVTSTTKL